MTLQHMTIITLTLGLMVTLGSVFITGIVASRHQLKYESFSKGMSRELVMFSRSHFAENRREPTVKRRIL